MGLLPRFWEGLEDVQNESSEAVEVHVDTFVTLVGQVALLLGQDKRAPNRPNIQTMSFHKRF